MDYHKVVIVPGPGIGVAPSRRRGRRRSSRGVSVILTIPGIGSSRSCHNTNGGPSRGDGRRTGRASLLFLAAISDALSSRSGCSSPAYLDVVMLSCKTRPHLDRCVMDSAHSLHFTVQMPSPLSSLTLSLSLSLGPSLRTCVARSSPVLLWPRRLFPSASFSERSTPFQVVVEISNSLCFRNEFPRMVYSRKLQK